MTQALELKKPFPQKVLDEDSLTFFSLKSNQQLWYSAEDK